MDHPSAGGPGRRPLPRARQLACRRRPAACCSPPPPTRSAILPFFAGPARCSGWALTTSPRRRRRIWCGSTPTSRSGTRWSARPSTGPRPPPTGTPRTPRWRRPPIRTLTPTGAPGTARRPPSARTRRRRPTWSGRRTGRWGGVVPPRPRPSWNEPPPSARSPPSAPGGASPPPSRGTTPGPRARPATGGGAGRAARRVPARPRGPAGGADRQHHQRARRRAAPAAERRGPARATRSAGWRGRPISTRSHRR